MERFQESREKAKKNIHIADHMLTVTYPLVKDTKLLLAILENVFLGYVNAMSAILYHDRLFKTIPPFQNTYESKLRMFKEKSMRKHKLSNDYLMELQEIRELLKEHKESPVEFVKQDKFVICSETYKMKTIGLKNIQQYIDRAKLFIAEVDKITQKNESLFR